MPSRKTSIPDNRPTVRLRDDSQPPGMRVMQPLEPESPEWPRVRLRIAPILIIEIEKIADPRKDVVRKRKDVMIWSQRTHIFQAQFWRAVIIRAEPVKPNLTDRTWSLEMDYPFERLHLRKVFLLLFIRKAIQDIPPGV